MEQYILIALTILILVALIILLNMINRLKRKQDDLRQQIQVLNNLQDKQDKLIREEFAHNRVDQDNSLRNYGNLVLGRLDNFANQLQQLTNINEQKQDKLRETLEIKMTALQEDNNKKLEKIRETVDEKLHATLEQRLGESFKLVSDRLEQVHKGLGEMQNLANGVGDLKKVLSNVKTRGILGEVQLENLLEQILVREQYEKNVATRKGHAERVEFAVKLPGNDDNEDSCVWLPIDAKFPLEDYQRLIEAQDKLDLEQAEEAGKALVNRLKSAAKDIREKYLDPPNTTDFAIMFLPIEGLYAEVLQRPDLFESLQRDYRVITAGPTVLAALLNSLQLGFKTLAIEKRSSEVWELLGAVKTEFGKFGVILDKTQKKLQEASNTIEEAGRRSRSIERKLRNVQKLPADEAQAYLSDPDIERLEEESYL
ncbi:MAG: DNA recombination protein RmuC [Peptococcia bacterium]